DPFLGVSSASRVAEVVSLVNHYDIGKFSDALESLREIAFAAEIGVTEDCKVAEVSIPADAADVRQPFAQVRLPDAFLRRLGREEYYALALVQHKPLDQHQTDKRLAETHSIAKKRAALLARDLHQRPVRLLLVTVDL